jgi:uncharacterized SAM-binding protein YcdF (DUF218 family)
VSGIVILVAAIVSIFFNNFNLGIMIFCILACLIILYGRFYEKLVKKKWLTFIIIAILAFVIIMVVSIGAYGKNDTVTYNEDAVIVLGAGIKGEQVSSLLSRRLDKAVEYAGQNANAVIVVSGGRGPQEDITEALAMERYLLDKGLPKEQIIKEEAATSTYENIQYSKEVLDGYFEYTYEVVLITSDFHIYRSHKLAEKLGLNATVYHSKIDWYSVPMNYSRECIAIIKLWLTGG